MCSIVVSTDTKKARDLVDLNASRGTHSHSIFYVNTNNYRLYGIHKMLGSLDPYMVNIPNECVAIIHQQAPTTEIRDLTSVHPSVLDNKDYLWHNGIIKDSICEKIYSQYLSNSKWDTNLLHAVIVDGGYEKLGEIDGSFACVRYVEGVGIHIFRNEIAPLYFDGDSFSSTEFSNSWEISPNIVFNVEDFKDGVPYVKQIADFATNYNPYYFGD